MATDGVAAAIAARSTPFQNPYAGHRQLSEKEQELLGEYARLAATIRRIAALSSSLASNERHGEQLTDLRVLERKMGLVLTLFKASVWSLIQSHQDELMQEEQGQEGYQEHGQQQAHRAAWQADPLQLSGGAGETIQYHDEEEDDESGLGYR